MRWLRGLSLCSLMLVTMAACSSSHSSNTVPPADAGTPAVTLDNVCDVLPTRYCQQDRPCCAQAGFAFDQAGCEVSYRASCAQGVAAVAIHKAAFHAASIDACVAAVQPFEDKCSLTAADFASLALKLPPCKQVFEGTVAVGAACNSDSECAPAPAPNATSCVSGSCQSSGPGAAQGEACVTNNSCAFGLICDSNSQQCIPDPQPEFFVYPQGCSGSTDAGP